MPTCPQNDIVGDRARNHEAHLALIQVLLADRLNRRGQPYYRGRITGQYDNTTATALAQFREEAGDRTPTQPLRPGGPVLLKLAKGTDIAVMDGTAVAYRLVTTAARGQITYNDRSYGDWTEIVLTGYEIDHGLARILASLASDLGITFDIEIRRAPGSQAIRAAYFTPRALAVFQNGRWGPAYAGSGTPQSAALALHTVLVREIRARCGALFPVRHQADRAAQQRLGNLIAAVVVPELDWAMLVANGALMKFKREGLPLAVRFLEHYLSTKGTFIRLSKKEALTFYQIREAVELNFVRFRENTFVAPSPANTDAFNAVNDVSKSPGPATATFEDSYKYDIALNSFRGARRASRAAKADWEKFKDAYLSAGSSSVTSDGEFKLSRIDDKIRVTGNITHNWDDPGYNFDFGQPFAVEAEILERHGKAKQFFWKAEWTDRLTAELKVLPSQYPKLRMHPIERVVTRWQVFSPPT